MHKKLFLTTQITEYFCLAASAYLLKSEHGPYLQRVSLRACIFVNEDILFFISSRTAGIGMSVIVQDRHGQSLALSKANAPTISEQKPAYVSPFCFPWFSRPRLLRWCSQNQSDQQYAVHYALSHVSSYTYRTILSFRMTNLPACLRYAQLRTSQTTTFHARGIYRQGKKRQSKSKKAKALQSVPLPRPLQVSFPGTYSGGKIRSA